MAEVKQEVRTIQIQYECDNCGGTVRSCEQVLSTSPATYLHKCSWCGKEWALKYFYPRIEHEPVFPAKEPEGL